MEPRTAFPPSLKMAEQQAPTDRDPRSLPELQDGQDSGHVTKHMTRVPSNVTLRKSAEASEQRSLILGYFHWPPGLLLTGLRSSCASVHPDLVELQPDPITLVHPGEQGTCI